MSDAREQLSLGFVDWAKGIGESHVSSGEAWSIDEHGRWLNFQSTQAITEVLGEASRYDYPIRISKSLHSLLKSTRDLATLTHPGPVDLDLDQTASHQFGREWELHDISHRYHHDDFMLDDIERAARQLKWTTCERAWHRERAHGSSSPLAFADFTGLRSMSQWFNDSLMDAYTDLIVRRSLEDPERYSPAFRVNHRGAGSRNLPSIRTTGDPVPYEISQAGILLTPTYGDSHWSACALDIFTATIAIYDSLPTTAATLADTAQVSAITSCLY